MTEAAIETRVARRSLRVARRAGPQRRAGAWGVRIYVKPFVDWIWAGCLLMALGGFVAVSDRRYRLAVRQKFAGIAAAIAR